jgi:hypothetical protein
MRQIIAGGAGEWKGEKGVKGVKGERSMKTVLLWLKAES